MRRVGPDYYNETNIWNDEGEVEKSMTIVRTNGLGSEMDFIKNKLLLSFCQTTLVSRVELSIE